ncbi:MAG: arginine repressor [Chloroflexota bacterium]
MNDGSRRRELVRQLVASGRFRSQGEIVAALEERGVTATQATVSRDLASLGAMRGTRAGSTAYLLPDDVITRPDLPQPDRLERLLRDLPLLVDEAPPLLVLRTSPGGAQAIASAIDLSYLPGVVGTVAGDDTIFIACRDAQAVRQLRERIESVRAGHRSISEQPTRSTS